MSGDDTLSRVALSHSAGLNLVESWLAVATGNGEPVAEAIRAMNADLGTSYAWRRVWEWRTGRRPIPQRAQDYMLRCCIAWAIRQEGGIPPGSDEQLDRLAARLGPPETPARGGQPREEEE